jgi:hypothetical protein
MPVVATGGSVSLEPYVDCLNAQTLKKIATAAGLSSVALAKGEALNYLANPSL